MVSAVTRGRIVLLCGLLLMVQYTAAAILRITAEQTSVELGQPIWLTLSSDQTAVSLASIDFTPWQGKVVLPRSYDITRSDDNRHQTLRLRVYPLQQGQLTLPSLHFLSHTSPPLPIKVLAAMDSKTHAPIAFQVHVSTTTPWQQQQVIVACRLTLRDAYAVFTQPTETYNDVQLLSMQVQHQVITAGQPPLTQYQLGWVVIPSRAGKLHLQLPPIQYVKDGVVSRQFYVPPLALNVQALPAWLPGTIPVGTVNLTRYDLPRAWMSTAVLSRLQLHVQLDGVARDSVPAYVQQLHSDRHVQYYAVQQHLATTIDHAGIHQQLRYAIPLVARHIGLYRLPNLRLQYFDPRSGTLKTAEIHGPAIVIVNGWIKVLLLLFTAAVLVVMARWLLRWLMRYWRRSQTYRLALRQLPQADSLSAIRQVMQTMAQAEGWSWNFTYRQWQAHMHAVTPLAQQLSVASLNAASYARAAIDTAPITRILQRICRQRRFALR